MRMVAIFCWLVLFSACFGNKNFPAVLSIKAPQVLFIDDLNCIKLSEKLASFGSVNDEIVLVVFYLAIDGAQKLVWHSELVEIGEEGEKMEINKELLLREYKSSGSLKLVLLEQDTERSVVEMVKILRSLLDENKTVEEIRKKMRDDDLLGVQTLKIENAAATGELRFWGMQLFDEFEYVLKYRFE